MERRRQLYGSGLARQIIEDNCFLSRNTGGNLLDIDANKGSILNVRSKSIVWNQIIEVANSKIDNTNIVSISEDNYVINATIATTGWTWTIMKKELVPKITGHKYFCKTIPISGSFTSSDKTKAKLATGYTDPYFFMSAKSLIISASNIQNNYGLYALEGDTFTNYKVKFICIDLTLIFGAGNEPTTVEEFEAWLAQYIGLKEYYPYDEGSILNVNMLGIQTTAINSSVLDTNYLDVEHIYGKLNGSGEYIQVFPSGIKSAGSVSDLLNVKNRSADVTVGNRAYEEGDENDSTVLTDKTNTNYPLSIPLHYTNLVYINSTYHADYTPINGEYNCSTSGTENILVKPNDYTQVEYIESTGTQYIDTGVSGGNLITAEIKAIFPNDDNSKLFGYRINTTSTRNIILASKVSAYTAGYYYLDYGDGNQETSGVNIDSNIHTFKLDKNKAYIDGALTNTYIEQTFTGGSMYLFACNQNGEVNGMTRAKIYYTKILNNDVLVRNLIPAKRNSDNVLGMYDTVSGNFLINQGTGEFVAGPVIEDCRSVAPIMDIEYTSPIPSYADDNYYGIKWREDQNSLVVERIGKSEYHISLPIQSKMRRCAVADDGTVKYINPNDYTKFEDGTTAHYDGTDGQIMVEIPDYYYEAYQKIENDVLWNYLKLYPKIKKTNSKKLYFGAFEMMTNEASTSDDNQKAFSISMLDLEAMAQNITLGPNCTINRNDIVFKSNVADYRNNARGASYDNVLGNGLGQARTNITMAAFRTLCQHRGANWSQEYFEAYQSLLRLYLVEYANFNSQAEFNNNRTQDGYKQGGLGNGVTTVTSTQWGNYNGYNPIIQCGVTIPLVNETNIINYEFDANDFGGNTDKVTIKVPSYRGIENPFGHIWKFIDGYIRHTVSDGGSGYIDMIYTCDDISKFTSIFTEGGPDGYELLVERPMLASGNVSSVLWNKKVFFPKATSANKYSDYCYSSTSSANNWCAFAGGNAYPGGFAGLLAFYLSNGIGYASVSFGSRLLYTPN